MKSSYVTKLAYAVALSAIVFNGCGGPSTSLPAQGTNNAAQASSGVLLDSAGGLDANDMHVGNMYADRYQVNVQAGDHLLVDVTSTAFDTTLEVTPPSGGSLVNDDWQGDRTHSRIEFVATAAGELKIQVSSYTPQTVGAYRVTVQRAPAGGTTEQPQGGAANAALPGVFLGPGQHANGQLAQGDLLAPDGTFFDQVFINSPGNEALTLRIASPDNAPIRTFVSNARGQAILPSSPGVFILQGAQLHRVQIAASTPGQGGQWAVSVDETTQVPAVAVSPNSGDHQIPTDLGAISPIQVGQQVRGALAATDTHMQTGEFADVYEFQGHAGITLNVAINSDAFDTYLLVVSPTGQVSDNDDSGGTRNSALSIDLPHDGTYRVFVTSYRPGETGDYLLKVLPDQRTSPLALGPANGGANGATAPAAGPSQNLNGNLAQGDRQLQSGEFSDEYTFNLTAGTSVHIGVTSSAFDTYLIVQPPSGESQQNDDLSQDNRNSGIDLQVSQTGPYRVVVTSYRPGETGDYALSITGATGASAVAVAATPAANDAPATPSTTGSGGFRTITGALAQGDSTLQSGEFRDEYPLTLPAGANVHLQLHSSAFDTYLIVFPPQGQQQDNDDASQGNTDSALDFVATSAGNYRVVVTSFRAGETGPYELTIGAPGAQSALPQVTTPSTTPDAPANAQPATTGSVNVAAGARQTRGTLARGDQTLQSGEFVDHYTMHFDAGSSVRLRLTSAAFDTYLLVRTPSGRQLDNDDLTPSDRNSGLDIPLAEAGNYEISVTSYRAGETGAYVLAQERGPSIPGAAPAEGQPASANSDGGRLYGIFAGISDYPGSQNDLPECANDAVKMSQTLTQAGLLDDAHQILLTDGEATPDGIRQAFARFAGVMRPSDVFIFFYSGHGGRNPGSHDAREIDGTDETIFLFNGEIVDDEMGTMFDALHAGTSILSLDSCFSGGFAKDVITRPGRIGMFSSEEDVTSGVAAQFQAGGYLSYFLRSALAGEADGDPHDRVLTVGELTHFVYRQFGQHVTDVRMGAAYQQLVVDRGAVSPETVLWAYRQ